MPRVSDEQARFATRVDTLTGAESEFRVGDLAADLLEARAAVKHFLDVTDEHAIVAEKFWDARKRLAGLLTEATDAPTE